MCMFFTCNNAGQCDQTMCRNMYFSVEGSDFTSINRTQLAHTVRFAPYVNIYVETDVMVILA